MKIKLLDLFKRKTPFDKKQGVVLNGESNDYAEKVDRLTDLSITSKMSCTIMASFIHGNGVGDESKDIIVFEDESISLQMFSMIAAKTIAKHRGIYIHVDWNANFEISGFKVLPYHTCRKGEKDDEDYNAKILVTKEWVGNGHHSRHSHHSNHHSGHHSRDHHIHHKQIKDDDISVIDVFNPNENVITAQVEASKGKDMAEKWKSYKGQIWYVNPDIEFEYALARIDPVMNDCDSEAQSSVYKNRSTRKGFFGKTMIITKPLTGTVEDFGTDVQGRLDHQRAITEEEEFTETARGWLGAENTGNMLHVQLDHTGESFDDVIKIVQFKSDINDKLFKYTEESVFRNILMAFNNLPEGLVRSEGSMFGNSGEMLRVMKETYQQNVSMEIAQLEFIINRLMKLFKEPVENIELIPLVEKTEGSGHKEEEEEKK